MLDQDILCATDLSPVSDDSVRAAREVAERLSRRVTLLHVLGNAHALEDRDRTQAALDAQRARVGGDDRVITKLREGDLMKVIVEESQQGHSLLVLGTHGVHGLRQNLFGSDILKLVRHAATPSLVVQQSFDPEALLQRIVMPVAAHPDIDRLLNVVVALACAFSSEVHVYQLIRPGEAPSDELLANKRLMLDRLTQQGVRHREVNEPSTVFSAGFAGPTIGYAERANAGAIAIMAHASDEYRYIADAEKERVLANNARIPVLCA